MFQLSLPKTAVVLSVFTLVTMISGVANAQSGTRSGAGSPGGFSAGSATRSVAPSYAPTQSYAAPTQSYAAPTQSFGQNPSFAPVGSPTPAFAPAGSFAQPFTTGATSGCSGCSGCNLPPIPTTCGTWQYPPLVPGARSIFPNRPRRSNCNSCGY